MTCATECVSFEFSSLSVINHRSDNGNFPGVSRLAHVAVVAIIRATRIIAAAASAQPVEAFAMSFHYV